jgi:predicted metal-dependent peptidase
MTTASALTGPDLKMARAKTSLILLHPFYATLACNIPWIKSTEIPTMATDGDHVYWNPDFVDKMTLDETKGVICHEIMHCVFLHMFRMGARDRYNWNVATDYVINDLLTKEGFVLPKGALLNPQLVQAGKELAENVYSMLPPPPPPDKNGQQPGMGNGGPMDKLMEPKGTQAERTAKSNIMKVRIAQAAQAAKMCGKLSGNLERLVGEELRPQVDWKDVLRRFVSVRAKVESSYAKPKRRFLADDLYLPSLTGERMGGLTVAVDCSGSIGARELNEFAAEIYAIVEDCRPAHLDVLYFDSEISHHDHYEPDDAPRIVGHGGGGTAFSPIFKYVSAKALEPVACVVLTDGYCSDYGDAPEYPVLWVTTGAEVFPWGEVVKMKTNG